MDSSLHDAAVAEGINMSVTKPSIVVAAVVAIAAALLASAPAAAQCGLLNDYLEIIPGNASNRAHFGSAIAIDRDIVLIAAETDAERGERAGAVFVFDISDPASPVQKRKLVADDGDERDYFGCSVALRGNLAVIGAKWDEPNGEASGSAYLFDIFTGQQIRKLLPDDGEADDGFGSSVAMNDDVVVVGARYDDPGGTWSGSAYVFDVHTGEQIAKIVPRDPMVGAAFGESMALQGNILIIGADRDDQAATDCGAVYVFDITDPANPMEIRKLTPDDASDYQLFGWCVALDGNTAIIGSIFDDDHGDHSGSAYLFDVLTGMQLAKLIPDRFSADHNFGSSVSIVGNYAAVGAESPYDTGYATVYDITDPNHPTLQARLEGTTVRTYECFGSSVSIVGSSVFVGAWGRGTTGSVYCFDVDCGPTLSLTGSCPGLMSLTVSGATPNRNVAVLYARNRGSVTIPQGYPCAGTRIGLGASVALAGSKRADGDGNATFSATVPLVACGNIFVQALDLTTCGPSNVVPIGQ